MAVGCGSGDPPAGGADEDAGATADAMDDGQMMTADAGDTGQNPDGDNRPADTGFDFDGGADGGVKRYPTPQVWRLEQETDAWSVFDMAGRPSRYAPTSPIRAAFDIEHTNKVFVLTDDQMHVMLLHPPRWKEPVGLAEIDTSLEGADIKAAWSDPRMSPNDDIVILGIKEGTPTLWTGSYDLESDSFADFGEGEPVDWMSGDAPDPTTVVAAWRDNRNSRDWMSGEPMCGVPQDEFQAYVAMATPMTLHMNDPWYCKDHFQSMPIGMAPAAQLEGFPGVGEFEAATWHDRDLFLFAPN